VCAASTTGAGNHFPQLHFHDWWSGSVSAAIDTGRLARFTPPCNVRVRMPLASVCTCVYAYATYSWTRWTSTRARVNAGVNATTTWCSLTELRYTSPRDFSVVRLETSGINLHAPMGLPRGASSRPLVKPGPAICRWLLITLNCSRTSDDRFRTYRIISGNLTVIYSYTR